MNAAPELLMVDDDQGHVELIRRNLRRAGFTNVIATMDNGEAALDYVFRRGAYADRPDRPGLMILMDLKMPGRIDGSEALRQLKADPTTKAIPVIMLTTTDDPREVSRCYELGCNVYVTKPVDPASFSDVLRKLGQFITVMRTP
ncbi:MAG: response regulator [Deltaproteobacteria bacterium]|jgi:CheY-like chemotaxis protein|nr:response regulator [Deltaproteobacteria bacterium]